MLDLSGESTVEVVPVAADEVAGAEFESVIGHADTANVVSGILGREVKMNRTSVKLVPGDVLYVAQVTGGRLPEGATTIPEGMSIAFLKVRALSMNDLAVKLGFESIAHADGMLGS